MESTLNRSEQAQWLIQNLKPRLESIFIQYNKRAYVYPDPLVFLYDYPDKRDREIAGLIAACLAYGQVLQIMKAIDRVLSVMQKKPFDYVMTRSEKEMAQDYKGFRYRFAAEHHVVALLTGMQQVIRTFDSLESCFRLGMSDADVSTLPGLIHLCRHLDPDKKISHLLADPEKTSACKRSHLFLRWMVRRDEVDPGGWETVDPSLLIIPVDRHIHRIGHLLGLTGRNSADLKTALEITNGLRLMDPSDPVKYDFCLSRYGIRNELTLEDLKQKVYD